MAVSITLVSFQIGSYRAPLKGSGVVIGQV